MSSAALPSIVEERLWQRELNALRAREKAATRELDAIAAQRRRLPMVAMPDYVVEGERTGAARRRVRRQIAVDLLQPHVVSRRNVAVPGMHVAVHPSGVPGQLRRPVCHRHPGAHRRSARIQAAGGQPG